MFWESLIKPSDPKLKAEIKEIVKCLNRKNIHR